MTDWENQVQIFRNDKDSFFENHPRSPIPRDERDAFDGLNYFELDEAFRVKAHLDEYSDKERITVQTTQDGEQEYIVYGSFTITLHNEEVTIEAYRQPEDDGLWVPFRDETNGDETYEAGRYLDLEDEDQEQDGRWVLDFNQAYNPFCVYADQYECPLVPTPNWLDVPIEAGEKGYKE